jgi:hypothetical protein
VEFEAERQQRRMIKSIILKRAGRREMKIRRLRDKLIGWSLGYV